MERLLGRSSARSRSGEEVVAMFRGMAAAGLPVTVKKMSEGSQA